ncbi:MAG: bifunctional DNA-formamidopyrimidine glycosylase/DNA-(apurinic or apyrimidinic site) lyase [Methylophilaceae bacterium]
MPELPEVEITKQGLLPLINHTVSSVVIRNAAMRWPIPMHLTDTLVAQQLLTLKRRAKYIQLGFENGTLLLHLGMSGSIRLLDRNYPPEKHDHFDIVFKNQQTMRLTDPRRFGAVLWAGENPVSHPLLCNLGPEPLEEEFDGRYLYNQLKQRKAAIKTTIMNASLVVGVGNIYANEALFRSGIHPQQPSNQLSLAKCKNLVSEIKSTLIDALEAGGSSLRDFAAVNGNSGYFQQSYYVYGRTNQPCKKCQSLIKCIRLGQRSTFYCETCQKHKSR